MKRNLAATFIGSLFIWAVYSQPLSAQSNPVGKAPATAVTATDPEISLNDRLFIFSKSYSSIQHYFAHWQDVPNLKLDDV